jgi:hypothetical protein
MHASLIAGYALSDLRNRKTATFLTGVAVFFAALSVLLLGFYGLRIRDRIEESVDEESLTRVTVDAPVAAGARMRFGEETLGAIRAQPGVRDAWGRVDVGADVALGQTRIPGAMVEGTQPQDPLLSADRMVFGRTFTEEGAHEAIFSESMLHRLGGRIGKGGVHPSSITIQLQRSVGGTVQTHEVGLSIVGVLKAAGDVTGGAYRVFVPGAFATELDRWLTGLRSELPWDNTEQAEALLPYANVYAFETQVPALRDSRDDLKIDLKEAGSFSFLEDAPGQWLGLVRPPTGKKPAELEEAVKFLQQASIQTKPASVVDLDLGSGVVRVVALETDDPRWVETPHRLPPVRGAYLADSSLASTEMDLPRQLVVPGNVQPTFRGGGDLYCTHDTLRDLCRRPSMGAVVVHDVERDDFQFAAAASLLTCQTETRRRGFDAEVFSLPIQKLTRFRVTSRTSEHGELPASVMKLIEASPTSHHAVKPPTQLNAHIRGEALTLEGTEPQDPAEYASGLYMGTWLGRAHTSNDAVLPWKTLRSYFPDKSPREWLGKLVKMDFEGEKGKRLSLQFQVVGVSTVAHGYASRSMLEDLKLWQEGQLIYNPTEQAFEDPLLLAERNGAARSTVHVESVESLEHLVGALESKGYHVEHRLGDLKRASTMGRTVLLLALGLAASALIGGLLSSWITASIQMESKQREIGILRSLGMSRKDVLSIFAFQGLVVGAAVHGLAVFAAVSIEPDLSTALAQTMGSSLQEVLPVRLMSLGALDVHLLGWMASVGFCLLGSTSAARRAYGIKLSEALYIKR